MMNVTGPEGERGDIRVLNPGRTTAPVTRQSGHSDGVGGVWGGGLRFTSLCI